MVLANFYIETPRLLISHMDSSQDSHCDFLETLYNTEESRAHKSATAQMPDREAARRSIVSNDPTGSSGYGRYLVSLKTSTTEEIEHALIPERNDACTKIGTVGIKLRKFEGAPLAPDLGYALLPSFQGKGYATEAAAALVRWFEEEKGQKEFFGFCDPENAGSKGVLRRIGFEERGVRNIKGMYSNDGVMSAMVFSRGCTGDLEAYGLC